MPKGRGFLGVLSVSRTRRETKRTKSIISITMSGSLACRGDGF